MIRPMNGRRGKASRGTKSLKDLVVRGGVLSDKGIKAALRRGEIKIDPPPTEEQYTTSAVDLYLDGEFRQWIMPGLLPFRAER